MLNEEQWRSVLNLAEATADLSAAARMRYLESAETSPEIISEVISFIEGLDVSAERTSRLGTNIGRFTISAYLGGGGAGDVYSAIDTELQRTVALKFLRTVAAEEGGVAERFIREARTASALNHPNIVTIHEIVRAGSTLALVMEFVDGESLRRIADSRRPISQVVRIGRQIAQALAAAHAAGIIHRDVKPENVIVQKDLSVKVLDFGLAVWLPIRGSSSFLSGKQSLGGTWSYMSPEQRQGKALTAATDVYSLGLVLHELLTGVQMARDDTTHECRTVDSKRDLDPPSRSNPRTVKRLGDLVPAMLDVNPEIRPSMAAVANLLSNVESSQSRSLTSLSRRVVLQAVMALVLALGIGVSLFRYLQTTRSQLSLAIPFAVEPGYKLSPNFSPDGKWIAYAWQKPGEDQKIYVQQLDSNGVAREPQRLSDAVGKESSPAWAPDGRSIAFVREKSTKSTLMIWRLETNAGLELTGFSGEGLSWTHDGKWLIGSDYANDRRSIVLISLATGEKRTLIRSQANEDDVSPALSADASTLAYVEFINSGRSWLAEMGLNERFSPNSRTKILNWVDFKPFRVANPIWVPDSHDLLFIASPNGQSRIWRTRGGGRPELVGDLGDRVNSIALSPTGRQLVFGRELNDTNIWRLEVVRGRGAGTGARNEIISSSRMDQRPTVSPDGRKMAFESDRGGVTQIWETDFRTGRVWRLIGNEERSGSPRWSPDGKWIVFSSSFRDVEKIFKVPAEGGQPTRLTSGAATDLLPAWSADNQWIYFCSNRSGTYQIWKVRVEGGEPVEVTQTGGTSPELAGDGAFLYFQRKRYVDSELWRKDLRNGRDILVAKTVCFRCFTAGNSSVYFLIREQPKNFDLYALNEMSKPAERLGSLPLSVVGGLSLSSDEKYLYYAELDRFGTDLMVVNGIR